MVLLIDTNVLIDYLGRRPEFYDQSRNVIKFCTRPDVNGYVAFHSISNAWFILRKTPEKERRNSLKEICSILTVTGANHSRVVNALEHDDFKDFEDCLQDACALTVGADYIITRNIKDFTNAETAIITPTDFVKNFIDRITR